jgi:hypothetical protein
MIRFFMKSALLLGVILLPLPSVSSQGAAPAVKIGTLEAVSTLVSDLRQVCDRQPVACAAASQAVVQLGQQARVGAQMLSDFLNEKFGAERTS